MKPQLLGIGGAHIDRRGVMSADFIHGASIPGKMMEEPGGGMFNALRTAVQLGVDATLISARGGDAAGEMVASEAKRMGIVDLSSVFLDRTTASYTALLEKSGDVVAALADMSIYETALPRQISRRKTRDAIATSNAVLIDANMPQAAIEKLVQLCAGKPVFALAISPAKVVRLRSVLHLLSGLFLNQREARALLGLEQVVSGAEPDVNQSQMLAVGLQKMGLQRGVMTNGSKELWFFDGAQMAMKPPHTAAKVFDVTGAGDALAGATIAAWMQGKTFTDAIDKGLSAAALTVGSVKAVADFSDLKGLMR
jgi:sugar/nucleoside kinase (ribokinase family)